MTGPSQCSCSELLVPAHPHPLPALSRLAYSQKWGRSFTFVFRGKKFKSEMTEPHKLCCKREMVSWNWTTAQTCTYRDSKSYEVNPWLSKPWQEAKMISFLKIRKRYMAGSSASLTYGAVTTSTSLHQLFLQIKILFHGECFLQCCVSLVQFRTDYCNDSFY